MITVQRKNRYTFPLTLVMLGSILTFGYNLVHPKQMPKSEAWTASFKGLGTLSSSRLADLNEDGILDVVMGAGGVEFRTSDSAIVALNGADGKMLWKVKARDQVFGSPIFADISKDGIPDVFIGGRSAEMKAINGKTGQVIREYFPYPVDITQSDSGAYNFFTPQFIPDQDKDGHPDLLVSAGGYVKAPPGDPERPPGKILVISSANGKKLASATMPDGKEIYMSVVVADFKRDGNLSIIFGTGGETLGGNLYKAYLSDLLKNDLSRATLLESGYEKGFVAPPVLADITDDGVLDVIANSVNGRMVAIDGATEQVLWRVSVPGTEAYCSLAVGFFTADETPDFFTNFGIGTWPNLNQSVQLMVNGKTGKVEFLDSLGSFQESSPLAFDFNNDGFDEALLSINYNQLSSISNQLIMIDFRNDTIVPIETRKRGANVACTPWLGDMDQDGLLDIVYSHEVNPFDLLSIHEKKGLKIHRLKTSFVLHHKEDWGAYMGSSFNGIFKTRRNKSF